MTDSDFESRLERSRQTDYADIADEDDGETDINVSHVSAVSRPLTFVLEAALVLGGASILVWQFFGPDTAQSGWLVMSAASAVSIGLMLLYEGFTKP
jgi:hypothetical protein